MNQLEQLEVYLKHLGRPYVIKDVDPKSFNKINYTDENGKGGEVEYTKVVTIDSPESVKDYYPKIDLWYIPSIDKFVEPSSATNGETDALQADTAKDVLDYVGFVYWEMEDLGDQLDNVSEAANDVQVGKLTDYLDEMGIKYKVSDKNGTIDYVDASNGDKTATYTKEVEVSPGNTVYYIPELEGFIDPSDDASGGNNDLFVMDAWETARLMGSVYFDEDPEDTEKRLNSSKKESNMKTYECSMQKKIESLTKKSSEKRTVTKSYDVYTYDELSDDAKAKVKDLFLQWRGEEGDIFKEDCENSLADMFPNSDLKVQYSLTYSQGDGFNTYGTLSIKDLLNADFSKYPLNDSGITAPANKDAILAACDKADVYDIDLEENRRYGYSLADRLEVVPNNDEELTDEDTALLSDLENFAREVMEAINSKFEKNGYDYFYEMSEDEVRDMADANEYEFTEDGELA